MCEIVKSIASDRMGDIFEVFELERSESGMMKRVGRTCAHLVEKGRGLYTEVLDNLYKRSVKV